MKREGQISRELEQAVTPRLEQRHALPYDEVFDRVFTQVLAQESALTQERSIAEVSLSELLVLPQAQRKLLIRNSERFQSWALCQLLIRTSYREGFSNPKSSVKIAEVATEVAELVDPEPYGIATLNDLKAAAWAQLGNALRIVSDLHGSERAFQLASAAMEQGTGDPLEEARLADLTASLRFAQRRLATGRHLLDQAIAIYREVGDSQLEAKALLKLASNHEASGSPETAVEIFRQALELLDPAADGRLYSLAHQNIVGCLASCGRFLEAHRQLRNVRDIILSHSNPSLRSRLLWTEAKIARGLGQTRRAEVLFLRVKKAFVDLGIGYDAAVVSLDLATLYAEQGRTAELKDLIAEMVPIFRSRDVHREATAAILLLYEAVKQDTVSHAFVQQIRGYLDQARNNPELRFRPGG